LGWLHATPKSKVEEENGKTRQAIITKDGSEVVYPPCEMMYMVDYLFSCGPVLSGAMGASPLTHQEIYAWQHNLHVDLCPWEANALREMSRQYLSELLQSDKHDSPPPWIPEIDEESGKMVAEKVKNVLRG
jgi:hypothetical protein